MIFLTHRRVNARAGTEQLERDPARVHVFNFVHCGGVVPTLDDRWDDRARKSFIRRERTFWGFVDDTADGCWPWVGPHRGDYGCYPIVSMLLPAHRAMLMYLDIVVPSDRLPDHLCEIKRCVSPNHLEVVTRSQNVVRVYRRAADETRQATLGSEVPENWELWRRKKEIHQRREAEGWQRPSLVEGKWVARYGAVPPAEPAACRCEGCQVDGPGRHRY